MDNKGVQIEREDEQMGYQEPIETEKSSVVSYETSAQKTSEPEYTLSKAEETKPVEKKKKSHWVLKLGLIAIAILAILGVGAYLGSQLQLNYYNILFNINQNLFTYIVMGVGILLITIAIITLIVVAVRKYHNYKNNKLSAQH